MIVLRLVFPALLCLLMAGMTAQAGDQLRPPSGTDKCPVCGMFVARYPGWAAAIRFRDGTQVYFDGPKDLFTYYLNLRRYTPGQTPATVAAIQVKDYYSLRPTDGRKAFYVTGSDVFGPMGKELIPFGTAADARAFLNDHKGKRVLRFDEVTPTLLKTLE